MENQKRGPPPPMKLVIEVRRFFTDSSFEMIFVESSTTWRTTSSAFKAVSFVAVRGTSFGSQMSRENQYGTSSGKNCCFRCEAAYPPISKKISELAKTNHQC